MVQGVIDGNTHFYIVLENQKNLIFDVPITDFLGIIKYHEGDTITIAYNEGDPACTVVSLKGEEGDAQAAVETEETEPTETEAEDDQKK